MTETYPLYKGKVVLSFDPGEHIYSIKGKTVYGVTSIVRVIDKPALMYWAVNQAIKFLEAVLKPGVALDELEIQALLSGAKSAHKNKKNKAGDIGTLIHDWIEKYLKAGLAKKPLPKPPINRQMKNAIDGFFEWTKKDKVKFLISEQKIYSKKHKYAGTVDAEAMVNGKRTIIDFKTGKSIHVEAFLQAAAYLVAREEETGMKYSGGIKILRLSKGDKEKEITPFEVQSIDRKDIPQLLKVFLACLEIYKWQMVLKGKKIKKSNGIK